MKALQYTKFGEAKDVLKIVEQPIPEPSMDEVRIRVTTVGLNPMDWLIMMNPQMGAQFGVQLPATFAYDFAGVVEKVGTQIEAYKVGDRVFGTTYKGAAAEYILVNNKVETESRLFHTPNEISDEIAATLGVCGLTAAVALRTLDLQASDTLLIGGAAGGVGTFAVQLAKLAGAKVIGTSSNTTFDYLRSLGAEPVEYGDRLLESLKNINITAVTDLFSHDTLEVGLALGIKPEKMSTIIMMPEPPAGIARATGGAGTKEDMVHLLKYIISGELKVPLAGKFALADYQAAIELQASRHAHGKVIITL